MLVLLISQFNLVRSYDTVCVNGIRHKHCDTILTLVKVISSHQFLTRACIIDSQQVKLKNIEEETKNFLDKSHGSYMVAAIIS